MNDLVSYRSENGIAHIRMERPEKLNALNPGIVAGLEEALTRYAESDDRCAVLSGDGRAFSVGADLNDNPLDLWRAIPGLGVDLEKPVVAAVQGHVIGGAFVLAMHCDLIIAAEGTSFSYPEVAVGFTGGVIAGLVARIPAKVAMEFMLIGERLDAKRAAEVGMINKVVPQGEQEKAAREWAEVIAAGAPLVVSTLKRFSDQTLATSPSEGAARARRALSRVHSSADRFEGEAAFREKRTASYQGR